MEPLVSVVMPNYNTPEEYLRSAIESVLSQTYKNLELIIIDDASAGNDAEVIKSFGDKRITLLRNETNSHVAVTLNRGLACARGEYIARMDSDDFSLPKRIEMQVRYLQKHQDIDIVYTQAKMTGDRKGLMAYGIKNAECMKAELFFGCPVIHPAVMFRASFLKRHALSYSTAPEYKAAEDYELWSRCVLKGKISELPQALLRYRVHSRQVTSSAESLQNESAGRVRQNMLAWIGIEPEEDEKKTHSSFCAARASDNLSKTEQWARRLLAGNREHGAFNEKYFRQIVFRNFFVITVKTVLQKKCSLKEAFKLSMVKQALSPRYYPVYFKRFIVSKRLNRCSK